MHHVDALKHWLKTYNPNRHSIEDVYEEYMKASRDNFAGMSYYSPKELERDLLRDIRNTVQWHNLQNWELVLASTIYDEGQLNQDYHYPVSEHAYEANMCNDSIKVPNGKVVTRSELGYNYVSQFTRPFNVRVFNRIDGDYEWAFVFTNPADNTVLAISQRED